MPVYFMKLGDASPVTISTPVLAEVAETIETSGPRAETVANDAGLKIELEDNGDFLVARLTPKQGARKTLRIDGAALYQYLAHAIEDFIEESLEEERALPLSSRRENGGASTRCGIEKDLEAYCDLLSPAYDAYAALSVTSWPLVLGERYAFSSMTLSLVKRSTRCSAEILLPRKVYGSFILNIDTFCRRSPPPRLDSPSPRRLRVESPVLKLYSSAPPRKWEGRVTGPNIVLYFLENPMPTGAPLGAPALHVSIGYEDSYGFHDVVIDVNGGGPVIGPKEAKERIEMVASYYGSGVESSPSGAYYIGHVLMTRVGPLYVEVDAAEEGTDSHLIFEPFIEIDDSFTVKYTAVAITLNLRELSKPTIKEALDLYREVVTMFFSEDLL